MKRKFIISIIFSVLFLFIACENEEISTELVGTVFRGPISPVAIDGELNDAVFEAKFGVYNLNGKRIKSFFSNIDGAYSVFLSPGDYKIIPDKSAPIISAEFQIKEITVNAIGITQLNMFFDTGIR